MCLTCYAETKIVDVFPYDKYMHLSAMYGSR